MPRLPLPLLTTALLILAPPCLLAGAKVDKPGFTIRSVKNGAWSAPDTWDGKRLPREGDRVLIGRKTRVVYDVDSGAAIRYLQVAGVLSFARDRNTTLNVGVVSIPATDEYAETSFDCHAGADDAKHEPAAGERAALEIGTPDAPIPHPSCCPCKRRATNCW
jgi:hypothetical protein